MYEKGNLKNIQFPLKQKKIQPSRHLAQLPIWRGGLGILDIDTQLNPIKNVDSKVIKYHQCPLKRSHAKSIELNSEF